MSAEEVWIILIFGIWLLCLTVVLLAVVRSMGLLHLTAPPRASSGGYIEAIEDTPFDFAGDGPIVGSALSARSLELLPDGLDTNGAFVAVLFSNTCRPCLERAREWVQILGEQSVTSVALVSGQGINGEHVDDELRGKVSYLVPHEPAHQLALELEIHSVPFGVAVLDGTIAGKGYLRSAEDLRRLHQSIEAGGLVA